VAKTAVTLQEFTEDTKAVADAYTASVDAAAEAISADAVENAAKLAIATSQTAARADADLCIVPSPHSPPSLPLLTSKTVKAVISGSVTVEGYTVDTFGENETAAFTNVMGSLLNVSSDDVNVTVATAARRRILSSNVAISYAITVPDVPAAENLLASIKAVPHTDLVMRLKAEGLKKVSSVVVEVSDTITESITEPLEVTEVTEITIDSAEAPAKAPAPEPEVAPNMNNYVVGAVDLIGITPETFGVNDTIGFNRRGGRHV